MKLVLGLFFICSLNSAFAQAWKTLPKGVRILGYRNVTTSKIDSNFNQFGSQSSLGTSFQVDAATFNSMTGNAVTPGTDVNSEAYNNLIVGAYQVDASAQVNVQGTGFGIGLSERVMFYAEIAYYKAQVKTKLKRTKGNTYEKTAQIIENNNGGILDEVQAENLRRLIDVNERTIQSVITNHFGYRPLGDWYGTGYGDMETGLMIKVAEASTSGLLFYPGVILPTGRVDDPDILQDIGFGDGQFDFFGELATGYVVNDKLSFGTSLRYTYQAPGEKTIRVPTSQDFTLSDYKGNFQVKYGDKLNYMLSATFAFNDWFSVTPIYRYMLQDSATYDSQYTDANAFLEAGSFKEEHQGQITGSISSIAPFLKKKFVLPAQINVNLVKTFHGYNVPNASRFELEFRMLF
ncbi:MAG TPA: hypothetical protein VNJ01_15865 [Bacteriovoracaceae bacterium]|nr:hypothetical protein [Bacteriovoracaceae bacterium]